MKFYAYNEFWTVNDKIDWKQISKIIQIIRVASTG